MTALATPSAVGGIGDRALRYLARAVEADGMAPVRSGQAGEAAAGEVAELKLEPGAVLAVPLVMGDQTVEAIGTVTEVIGDRVIGFGHPMLGEGDVQYPMGTGYVHGVVASVNRSIKLGAIVRNVGAIRSDETTGVAGVRGAPVDMVPMRVTVAWPNGQKLQHNFRLLRQRSILSLLAMTELMDSVWDTRRLPQEHTLTYTVEVGFGPVGSYRVENLSSRSDIYEVGSDLSRPLAAMLNNPFGEAKVHSIDVTIRIENGTRAAKLEGVTLDRHRYAPGDRVVATARFRRYRGPRFTRTITLRLPKDLPPGEHTLAVGDWQMAQRALKKRRPRWFDPRNLEQLLVSLQRAAETRTDRLYAHLDLPAAGVTVDTQAIGDAPPTVAAILSEARPLDVTVTSEAVTAEVNMDEVVSGSTEVKVNVVKHPPRP